VPANVANPSREPNQSGTARAFYVVMNIPLHVTFRDITHSDALDEYVRTKATKLETFHKHITSCRVAIESPHRHRSHGRPVRVRIDMTVPGAELVVGRHDAEDPYVAVDDAFRDAERLLKQWVAKQRETRGAGATR
jgi:ribosomal subunit interface protein